MGSQVSYQTMQYFRFDALSNFVGILVCVFSALIILYSTGFMRGAKRTFRYFVYVILTTIASFGAVFANHFVLFIVCWGFLGPLLYLLINFGERKTTTTTARKAFLIIGGTDAFMLLGLGILWKMTGTFQMDEIHVPLATTSAIFAYLCLAAGAFAKAGAMPFHAWVPDMAEDAPTPVSAFLPASLDKLLGIYLLARISLNIFELNFGMNIFLMITGSITIIAAVLMALVQHDFKKLLGFHAVSQVGYMVLGIGTGNPLGIAGGLFHMLNNVIYKSCLFLVAGSVEKKAGTTSLEKLGGLSKIMPISFIAFLIAALAISGVPPFNGFASKWMIYQGVIETGRAGGHLWLFFIVAAIFGSALTLASFMKLVHAVFLGQPAVGRSEEKGDGPATMWIPAVILAAFCVIFGVFAYQIPLKLWIYPAIGNEPIVPGIWSAGLATILILLGIGFGFIIYLAGTIKKMRNTDIFVGGEKAVDFPEMRLSGTRFYDSIRDTHLLKQAYWIAERKLLDISEIGAKITTACNTVLGYLHDGVLPTYLTWCLLGMGILFYFLLW